MTSHGIRVGATYVAGTRFAGRGGRPRGLRTIADRRLDWRAVLAELPPSLVPDQPCAITIIDDLSGSMTGGHDAKGCRHEANGIAAQHLARKASARWSLRSVSFDRNSSLDLPLTKLDRKGLDKVVAGFLTKPNGSSSNLGPALAAVESERPPVPMLLVVQSDFQLFDHDVPAVLQRFINCTAEEKLALVFSADPPHALRGPNVHVEHIDPSRDSPSVVAQHIVEAANRLVISTNAASPQHRQTRRRRT